MDLNVRSVFNLVRDSVPLLAAAATLDDPARIITVSSVAGLAIGGDVGVYGYTASKAAVIHLTKNFAIELGNKHILANSIAPGLFQSKMARVLIEMNGGEEGAGRAVPNGRIGRPDDIAGVIVFLCSRAGSHINASVIPIDGGRYMAPSARRDSAQESKL